MNDTTRKALTETVAGALLCLAVFLSVAALAFGADHTRRTHQAAWARAVATAGVGS